MQNLKPFFAEFKGKIVAHGPLKKPLDFDCNLDSVMLGLGERGGLQLGEASDTLQHWACR